MRICNAVRRVVQFSIEIKLNTTERTRQVCQVSTLIEMEREIYIYIYATGFSIVSEHQTLCLICLPITQSILCTHQNQIT